MRRPLEFALAIGMASSVVGAGEVETPAWIDYPELAYSITATEVTVAQYRSCIEAGLCESGTVTDRCNYNREGFDHHPVNCVNHFGAEQYCEAAGGRLCTENEWLEACRGVDNRPFPYGEEFDLQVCNSSSQKLRGDGRKGTVAVGSLEQCEGGLPGLMDMAGNVSEWIADCKGDYCKFRGGGHMSNDPIALFAACNAVCAGNQKTSQLRTVGIRCCRGMLSEPD